MHSFVRTFAVDIGYNGSFPETCLRLLAHIIIINSNYSRLSLSRNPRDSVKYFEISIPRDIRFAELRKK